MTYVSRILVLLIVGLFMVSASASADDRLTVSGSLDNRFFLISNFSGFDDNFTSAQINNYDLDGSKEIEPQAGDADDLQLGVSRLVFTFNVEAVENTRLVFTTITDQFWGNSDFTANDFQFGPYSDVAIRLNVLYAEGLIPGTAALMRIGAMGPGATRLKSACILHCIVAPGVTLTAPLSDTMNSHFWYSRISDSGWDDTVENAGDDWAAGLRIELSQLEGLEVDLIAAYQLVDCMSDSGIFGDCDIQTIRMRTAASDDGTSLLAGSTLLEEDRYWVGVDAQYQYGDFTFSPTLLLHFGSTTLMNGGESDISSFLLDVTAGYQVGRFGWQARVAYSPGNPASDDLGDGSTLNAWQFVGAYNGQPSVAWFSLWGSDGALFTNIYPNMFDYCGGRSIRCSLTFDQFGLMHVAVRGDYTVNERTTLTGALGIFSAAEEVGRPARLGPRMVEKKASVEHDAEVDGDHKRTPATMVPNNPTFNYTGQDTHLATEIDVWLTHQVYSNTTLELWAAYAMNGDALNLMMEDGSISEAQDTVGGGIRVNYSF